MRAPAAHRNRARSPGHARPRARADWTRKHPSNQRSSKTRTRTRPPGRFRHSRAFRRALQRPEPAATDRRRFMTVAGPMAGGATSAGRRPARAALARAAPRLAPRGRDRARGPPRAAHPRAAHPRAAQPRVGGAPQDAAAAREAARGGVAAAAVPLLPPEPRGASGLAGGGAALAAAVALAMAGCGAAAARPLPDPPAGAASRCGAGGGRGVVGGWAGRGWR